MIEHVAMNAAGLLVWTVVFQILARRVRARIVPAPETAGDVEAKEKGSSERSELCSSLQESSS